MSDVVTHEVDVDAGPDETWAEIIEGGWLGDDVSIDPVVGGEGTIVDEGALRVLVVEEIVEGERFGFRWASFTNEPSRVEIELVPLPTGGTRVLITESPLTVVMRATMSVGG